MLKSYCGRYPVQKTVQYLTKYVVVWCTGRIFRPVSQIPYLRHRGKFTARTSDRVDNFTAGLARCRAAIEAIMYPKRSSTRRDTPYPGAPAAQSDRCRKKALKRPYLRHRGMFTAHMPDRPDAATAGTACRRANIEAALCPKRSGTRRETPHPRAPEASSDRCRK